MTKDKAGRIQRTLEAKNKVASFILVEDPVFCEPSGKQASYHRLLDDYGVVTEAIPPSRLDFLQKIS